METDLVIKVRDALKCGKNYPLRVMIDNSFANILENNDLTYVKWDDKNGVIYIWRLPNPQGDMNPNNKAKMVSVVAAPYDVIQAIELPFISVKDLPDLFTSINDSGAGTLVDGDYKPMSDDFQKAIIHTYSEALHDDRYRLTPADLNRIQGSDKNTADDYYEGRFTVPFRETARTQQYNKYVDEYNKNQEKP